MNEGWIKLYRCLMSKAIWTSSTAKQKVILITLLMMANHEGREWEWQGKQFKAMPGQFVTSAASIIKKAGKDITRQNVRTALEKFKKYEFLTYISTNSGLLVTIQNWELYQDTNSKANQPINHEVTNPQPTPNQQVTTNKNDKNVKNDKKYIYIKEFTEDKELRQTIIDFMKMRDKTKFPMTDRALKIMLNKLKDLSSDTKTQIKILERSIEHSWKTVYPLPKEGEADGVDRNRKSGQDNETKRDKYNFNFD
ncbi:MULTISPECIES: hypothetical protein [Clostridium]|uniref:Phage replisome organizer n=3 Tax=Clostridium TaxID=1485 RepID=A0ABY6SXN3_9CLOT|nr:MULTISPECIES: hypothetical protein [Clostridium]CAI3549065.1 putative phage replisome organizer [Clostridium neonatale]CAI3549690.1 putative phage replisome organizer [Clostridium neonatale]CAI3581555.1 putative phage replisome organizer [Clostridium neonatale]CAI3590538.1 putative phage replisome organizer [Clostridium neonatale]CAI3597049.1 putative phage replisome organizer [Clostridium neonatale]